MKLLLMPEPAKTFPEPIHEAWEQGYDMGYQRALSNMVLVGCRCHFMATTCDVCETVNKLRKG
jgi:hypothetical protein